MRPGIPLINQRFHNNISLKILFLHFIILLPKYTVLVPVWGSNSAAINLIKRIIKDNHNLAVIFDHCTNACADHTISIRSFKEVEMCMREGTMSCFSNIKNNGHLLSEGMMIKNHS